MAGWLEKILPPPAKGKEGNLPALNPWASAVPAKNSNKTADHPPGHLPNASLIYGIAAAILIAISLYFLFTGMWFRAILLLLPAGCFFGYAMYFLRHPN